MVNSILIVDDEEIIRESLADFFIRVKEFGVVDVAENGNKALQMIKDNKYDAVLTDINMPEMNGIQLVEIIREEKLISKIFMMSGYSQNDSIIRDLSVDGYFPKPFLSIMDIIKQIKS